MTTFAVAEAMPLGAFPKISEVPQVVEPVRPKSTAMQNIEQISTEIDERYPSSASRAIVGAGLLIALIPAAQMGGQYLYNMVTHHETTWQAIDHPLRGLAADLAFTGTAATLEQRRHRRSLVTPTSTISHL